jgi:hypothetical protein
VQVVELDHERPLLGEQLEEPPHRAVRAVALVRDRSAAVGATQRRQDAAQLARQVGVPALPLRRDVVVERVDEHAVRQLALELGGGAGEHQVAAPLR